MGKEKSNINLQYDRQLQNQENQNNWQSLQNDVDARRQQQIWLDQFINQSQQQEKMFGLESERWQSQFDIQNQYNAPESQVARLTAAGINPAALASQLSSGSSSASLGGSTGVSSPSPSGSFGHNVTPGHLNSPVGMSSDAAMFSSIAQLNDSLSKLSQTGLNVERQKTLLGAELESLVTGTRSERASAEQTELQNLLTKRFGDSKVSAEINKMVADAYSASASGDLSKSKELTEAAITLATKDDNFRKNTAFPLVIKNLEKRLEQIDADISLKGSQSRQADSSANYMNALTSTENVLREGKVTSLELSNKMAEIQNMILNRENIRDAATHEDKIHRIVTECERSGLINRHVELQIDKAIIDKDWSTVEHFFGVLSSAASSVGSVGNVLVGSERNSVQREFNSVWSDYINNKNQYPIESGRGYRLDDNGLLFRRP